MRYLAWVDGRVVEAAELRHDQPFVMQRVHTLGYCAFFLDHHLKLLRLASEELFGFASLCSVADAEDIIAMLLDRSRMTKTLSVPVAIRINGRGELSLEVETPTFGTGIYLRAKRFEAVVADTIIPSTTVQTSVSVALDALNDRRVQMFGGDKAIWIDAAYNLISRPWLPIFVVHRDRVYTPVEHRSVEYLVAKRAIERAGLHLEVRSIPAGSLEQLDEIFVVDIMSISAFSSIGNHRLLSTISQRIANKMELF